MADARARDLRFEIHRRERMKADPAYREKRLEQKRSSERKRVGDPAKRKAKNLGLRKQPRLDPLVTPFRGVDGEGVRVDGACEYTLFRIGDRELFKGGARLTTPEILSFILADPPGSAILLGFGFDYDISNILRDVPWTPDAKGGPSRMARILRIGGEIKSINSYTWLDFDGYPTIGVNWLHKNHLKVCYGVKEAVKLKDGRTIVKMVPRRSSERIIFETFGNFQRSFLDTLERYGIDKPYLDKMREMKDARASFDAITKDIRDYNYRECDDLAAAMEKFRMNAIRSHMVPKTWNGAGKIAQATLRKHGTITRKEIEATLPAALLDFARDGYYGGRFEITRVGAINEPVNEHDINSAYSAAMPGLPCLRHGTWIETDGKTLQRSLASDATFIAAAKFHHPLGTFLCGLPFRDKKGLHWPCNGQGIYWSIEMRSAQRLGAQIKCGKGWLYQKRCDCQTFDYVAGDYEKRLELNKLGKHEGEPLKYSLSSSYGKFAQRVGEPPFQNPIWAGLITATCRSMLNDAIVRAGDPNGSGIPDPTAQRRIVMIATDGVYATGAPLFESSEAMGAWKVEAHPSLFIVKPGFYWGPPDVNGKRKTCTRGASPKFLEAHYPRFEAAWRDYSSTVELNRWGFHKPLKVPLTIEAFIGLRLAYHRKRPDLACQWISDTRNQSFDWTTKRNFGFTRSDDGQAFILDAKLGDPRAVSKTYRLRLEDEDNPYAEFEMLLEAMPDVELIAPI